MVASGRARPTATSRGRPQARWRMAAASHVTSDPGQTTTAAASSPPTSPPSSSSTDPPRTTTHPPRTPAGTSAPSPATITNSKIGSSSPVPITRTSAGPKSTDSPRSAAANPTRTGHRHASREAWSSTWATTGGPEGDTRPRAASVSVSGTRRRTAGASHPAPERAPETAVHASTSTDSSRVTSPRSGGAHRAGAPPGLESRRQPLGGRLRRHVRGQVAGGGEDASRHPGGVDHRMSHTTSFSNSATVGIGSRG